MSPPHFKNTNGDPLKKNLPPHFQYDVKRRDRERRGVQYATRVVPPAIPYPPNRDTSSPRIRNMMQ